MARWIDADALMAHEFKNDISYKAFCNLVKRQPAADVAPVRHGTWTITVRTNVYGGREIICSECGEGFMVSPKTLEFLSDTERYCCRCGAKMDR